MDDKLKKTLEKMHYGLVGDSGAVQICLWTKKSLRGEGGCWKEKFYGISSAGCCQMTPNVMNCENMCLHCWRPIEYNLGVESDGKIMEPEELLNGIIEERKRLMNGFKGNKKVDKKAFEKALEPKLYTMSLSGEPTLYPHLGELFSLIRKKGAVSFLVTNGQNPDAIRKLERDGLPTQLVVSTNAPNEKLFKIWHRSCIPDSWEKFLETLDVMNSLKGKVRRVIRLTLVKVGRGEMRREGDGGDDAFNDLTNMTLENLDEYASLIRRADSDFVHLKGFKSVGYSRDRFGYDKQPWFSEVKDYAEKLCEKLGGDYEIKGEEEKSGVVMLARKGQSLRIAAV